jgi:ethanolamine utilization protein EutJ
MAHVDRPAALVDEFLRRAATRRAVVTDDHDGDLRVGVDLGTATIVICVVRERDREPIYWDSRPMHAVRDGVVVDFHGAARAVRELASEAQRALGMAIDSAATAHPPGVPASDCRACCNVLEQAGIECRGLFDEVSAARAVLDVDDGAIVDVGGGSTGVGIYAAGELVSLTDRPGGGHHLDLILAGALGIPIEDAELRKRTDGARHLATLTPGIERIAESVATQCDRRNPGDVHLAGGALRIPGAAAVMQRYLQWRVVAHPYSELITPFGIAIS